MKNALCELLIILSQMLNSSLVHGLGSVHDSFPLPTIQTWPRLEAIKASMAEHVSPF